MPLHVTEKSEVGVTNQVLASLSENSKSKFTSESAGTTEGFDAIVSKDGECYALLVIKRRKYQFRHSDTYVTSANSVLYAKTMHSTYKIPTILAIRWLDQARRLWLVNKSGGVAASGVFMGDTEAMTSIPLDDGWIKI